MALVIVAFGMGAVLASLSSAADSVIRLREQTFAEWVGFNQLSTTRLQAALPSTGDTNGVVDFASGRWQWQQTVTAMDIPGLRRIVIHVRRASATASGKSADARTRTRWLATVMGFRGDALQTPLDVIASWDGGGAAANPDENPGPGAAPPPGRHAGAHLRPAAPRPSTLRRSPCSHLPCTAMRRRMRVRCGRGFTLIELLVALFITAILFAMGYGALSQALTSRREIEEQSARLNSLQQACESWSRTSSSCSRGRRATCSATATKPRWSSARMPRAARDMGQSSSMAGQQGPALLSFTRGSWANPAGVPRAELERVSYLVRDGKLVRQNLPTLDTTAATTIVERELLDGVEALSFRFMDESLTWSASWPSSPMQSLPPAALLRARPVAVEITLRIKDVGVLTRIVEIAG